MKLLNHKLGFFNNKIFFLEFQLMHDNYEGQDPDKGILKYYDIEALEEKVYLENVNNYSFSTP